MTLLADSLADVLIVGPYASIEADREGAPFSRKLLSVVEKAVPRQHRERVAYQNMVRCGTITARAPKADVMSCSTYLEQDILHLKPRLVIGMGYDAVGHFFPSQDVRAAFGQWHVLTLQGQTCWFLPLPDPNEFLEFGERANDWPLFRHDLAKAFSELDRRPAPTHHSFNPAEILLIDREADARELLSLMVGPIGLDIETTTLRPYQKGAAILTAALATPEIPFAFSVDDNEWALPFLRDICENRTWISHFAEMELSWLWSAFGGVKTWHPSRGFHDSMALARVYKRGSGNLGLGALTHSLLGTDVKRLSNVNVTNLANEPREDVLRYNGVDAQATILLYEYLTTRMGKTEMALADRMRDATVSTVFMELNGVPVDFVEAQLQYDTNERVRSAVLKETASLYEVRQYEIEVQKEFRISAPADVGEALVRFGRCSLPKTAAGKQYKTDDELLAPLAETSPLAANVLKYRHVEKLISTYIRPIIDRDHVAADDRLHPTYTTKLTHTGRLSCEEPNIQNWPKRKNKEVRKIVSTLVERGGVKCLMVAVDYAQLEARVLAMLSECRGLCDAILTGFDMHSHWAVKVGRACPEYFDWVRKEFEAPDDKTMLKAARNHTKNAFVFASLYGSMTKSVAAGMHISLPDAQDLHNEFWQVYHGVHKWQKSQRIIYRDTATVRTATGLERHGILAGNEPLNTPIQGTAAHIVIDAMNALSRRAIETGDLFLHPLLNVHDDLTFIVPDSNETERYIDEIVKEMVKVRYGFQIVPLAVEVSVGPDWYNQEEILVHKGDYVR